MILLVLSVVLLVALRIFFFWRFQYWEKLQIPYLRPYCPFGCLPNPLINKEKGGIILKRLYRNVRDKGWKHAGIFVFVTPVYLPTNLDYIKNILTKDFEHFDDRGLYYNEKDDPLSGHLINLGGPKGVTMRKKLNSLFTPSSLKMMFQTLNTSIEDLLQQIHSRNTIDIHKLFTCFTIHVIASCTLGLECNIFKEEHLLFESYANKFLVWSRGKWCLQLLAAMYIDTARKLKVRTVPKETEDFFVKIVTKNIKYREENDYFRQDMMQFFIEQKNANTMSINEIIAQCFIFFIAAYETSTTTLTFALYELAQNLDIQDRVRREITSVLLKHQKYSYEAIAEMKYLNQIVDETMRKYPPFLYVVRRCTKDYTIPGEDVTIKKGIFALISILGIHHDEEIYPNPQKFDPDRFSKENKKMRHPYAYLPFGEGPRICIGKRFALMQIKFGLAALLEKYKFTLNEKTKVPLEIRTDTLVVAPKGDVLLDIQKIN
ncbi:probable cytochrome P450 6a20 isoform X1 [Tribolium castaneum]|uniref:probable cytochrome P450 6a20 isoform X1 n=1 Tax=Tribolium castaneum TaxID=7070 RepID=UPI0000D576F6